MCDQANGTPFLRTFHLVFALQQDTKMPKTFSALSGDLAFIAEHNYSQNVLENGMTKYCHHRNTMGSGVPAPMTAQLYRNDSDLHSLLWGYLGSPNTVRWLLVTQIHLRAEETS